MRQCQASRAFEQWRTSASFLQVLGKWFFPHSIELRFVTVSRWDWRSNTICGSRGGTWDNFHEFLLGKTLPVLKPHSSLICWVHNPIPLLGSCSHVSSVSCRAFSYFQASRIPQSRKVLLAMLAVDMGGRAAEEPRICWFVTFVIHTYIHTYILSYCHTVILYCIYIYIYVILQRYKKCIYIDILGASSDILGFCTGANFGARAGEDLFSLRSFRSKLLKRGHYGCPGRYWWGKAKPIANSFAT